MTGNQHELRSIAWTEAFPFVRLFSTFRYSIHVYRLLLGLACVFCVYLAGRVLDQIWLAGGGGVVVSSTAGGITEIDVFATRNAEELQTWLAQTDDRYEQLAARALVNVGVASNIAQARELAREGDVAARLDAPEHAERLEQARQTIDQIAADATAAINAADDITEEVRAAARRKVRRYRDHLILVLNGNDPQALGFSGDILTVFSELRAAAKKEISQEEIKATEAASQALRAQASLSAWEAVQPTGPFITLLMFQERCFAAAVEGAVTFRWGFSGSALDPHPSLLGSIASAGNGIIWFVTQRPVYALLYGLLHFAVFALFGGAICRHVAIHIARDETIPPLDAFRFAREKFGGLMLAPLIPAGVIFVGAIVMIVGGFVTAIPWIGTLLAGIIYGIALLGGFALAMVLLGLVLGFHLMWPTIAVEGSDAADGVQQAAGYVGQRPWQTAFYSLLLLLYGAVCFIMIRLIALLTLKLTHTFSNSGMSFFGSLSSAETETITRLNAMWFMPHWNELALLPTTGGVPFWGRFFNAPLNGPEWLAGFLIACWVFMIVGLVGAFAVSFFFCGSTQMYFLLRRSLEATDYDEVFYEVPEEELPAPEPAQEGDAGDPAPPGEDTKDDADQRDA